MRKNNLCINLFFNIKSVFLLFIFYFVTLNCSFAQDRPNFILILFDDLGYNDVGFNSSEIKTPVLDSLAKSSLVFDQYYVFPWCSATRAAVETGLNPASFGIRSLEHNFNNKSLVVPASVKTLPEKLHELGYYNVFLGKWHLSKDFEGGPINRGYDKAYGFLSGQIDHIKHDDHTGRDVLFRDSNYIIEEGHMTDLIYREAMDVIESETRPFYINISFSAPHYPIQSLQYFENENRHIENSDRRAYAGMVTHMDSVVGEIIKVLGKSGKLENTYLFIFSDNGGQKSWSNPKYYGGRFKGRKIMASNDPLRDYKTSVYEGGIRVPLLISGPNRLGNHKGKRSKQFSSVLDVVTTMLDLSGSKEHGTMNTKNLIDSFSREDNQEEDFYWQTFSGSVPYGGGEQEAIRVGNYKLVRSQRRFSWFPYRWKFPWDKYELFDLSKDIEEKDDISDKNPKMMERLIKKLDLKLKKYQVEFDKYSLLDDGK